MKEKSLKKQEEKYILSYKIENEKIIIELESGEIYSIPYTKENEKLIISKKETQTKNKIIKFFLKAEKVLALTQPLLLLIAMYIFIKTGKLINIVVLVVIGTTAIIYPIKYIKGKINTKKLNQLLNNQQESKENTKNNNTKTINQEKSLQDESEKTTTINTLDNYSLNELKTLRDNIEASIKEEEMNKNQQQEGPVLTKTINPKRK